MKLRKLTLYHIQIPLNIRFSQANQDTTRSSSILLELETEGGIKGYGESCPRTYVTGESPASVLADLQKFVGSFPDLSFDSFETLERFVTEELPDKIRPAALCAIELALLDAWSRHSKRPLIQVLGGSMKKSFAYTGVIPTGNIDNIRPLLSRFSFPMIKLKINQDLAANLQQVKSIKEIYGPDIPIQADVNTGWTGEEAEKQIPLLAAKGISVFEQPFLAKQNPEMAPLMERFGKTVFLMADESATHPHTVTQLLENKLFNRINLKISKHGGILQTLKVYREAASQGISCQLGAHFGESSLLTSAALLVASCVPHLTGHEGGLGKILLKEDVCPNPLQINSQACIQLKDPHFLGLGIEVDMTPLMPYVESQISLVDE